MVAVEAAVALVHAFAAARARRTEGRPDTEVDPALGAAVDAGVERVHQIVAERLSGERALATVEEEAGAGAAEPSPQARRSLEQALEGAADRDAAFARALKEAVAAALAEHRASAVASGDGIAIVGNVTIHVDGAGSVAALRTGDVATEGPSPSGPRAAP